MGNPYVIAELSREALSRCVPDLRAFREAAAAIPRDGDRSSIHVYARSGEEVRARMFAPLAGTWEDPATGSANAPLAGLLLSLGEHDRAKYSIHQGVEMGRPSRLEVVAERRSTGIHAILGGSCVPVSRGSITVD